MVEDLTLLTTDAVVTRYASESVRVTVDSYWLRSAVIGSMRDARRAGM